MASMLHNKDMSNSLAPIEAPEAPDEMTPSEVRRLARAFEYSAAGIALQTPDGVWQEVNKAFCDLVGYTREELRGKSFTEITHKEDIARSLEQLQRLNRREISSFRFDKRYLHATGREVWVRLDVSMVLDEQDRPELIITQANDITASRQIREQLAENEARLSSIIRSMAEGVIVLDTDGSFSVANERAAQILGAVPHALESLSLSDFESDCLRLDGTPMPVEEFPAFMTLATGQPQREVVLGLERPDGQPVWIQISTEPVHADGSDEVIAVVATFSDITERISTERALRESEERLSLAIEGAKLGMWDWQLDTRELSFNAIAERMLGYRKNEVASNVSSVRALAHPDDEGTLVEQMEAHLVGRLPFFEADVRMRRKSGGYIWTNIRGRVTERNQDDRPLRVTGMMIDISQRKQLEARLHELATTDELTGLFNRRHGNEVLGDEIDRTRRTGDALGLMLLDIDHFKQVNDQFGHDVGDKLLAEVAELLQTRLRKTDTTARWGGEEFAVILPNTDSRAARRIADEMLHRMQEIRTPDGKAVSASFGVVDYRGDESASELVKRADRMMYRAKSAGRARVEVESSA
mgnify:CR=1 FL=1